MERPADGDNYSSTIEDYLKQIYLATENNKGTFLSMKKLAENMNVSPGSVTSMLKTLADAGLAEYRPRIGSKLTGKGRSLALNVLRRHRLIERFLVDVLDIDWADVHEDAEKMEHVVTDRIVEKMDKVLGYPKLGPHGKPIPSRAGKIEKKLLTSLNNAKTGIPLRVVQIEEKDPEFLRFLSQKGLRPGSTITVTERATEFDTVTLQIGNGDPIVMGARSASSLLTEPLLETD